MMEQSKMMDEATAAKAREASAKATAVLVDALSPLIHQAGVVALNVTALVVISEGAAVPVVVTLGVNPIAVSAIMDALRGFAGGHAPLLDMDSFAVSRATKQ